MTITILPLLMLLSQSPVENNIYKGSIMSVATAHIIDMTTTGYCKGAQTCVEKNPFLAPFQDNPWMMGAVKGLIASSLALAVHEWLWKRGYHRLAIASNLIITGTIGYIGIRNSRIK